MTEVDGDAGMAPGRHALEAADDVADRPPGDASTRTEEPDLLAHVASEVSDYFEDGSQGTKGSEE
jgi:hypothetical protein